LAANNLERAMRRSLACLAVLALAACASTTFVTVPPRLELKSFEPLGIVEFASASGGRASAQATRQFQERIQAAQPGTRFIDLGTAEALLESVASAQFDVEAFRKIGDKYGIAALFIGELAYSEPSADFKMADFSRGAVRAEIRGELSARLVETRTGASVWTSSAWARREIGSLNVSAQGGVSAHIGKADPRDEMVRALVHHLTADFRPARVQASSAARR